MIVTRRRWLTAAAGAAVSSFVPFSSPWITPAFAARAALPTKAGMEDETEGTLRLCVGVGVAPALRDGIQSGIRSVVASCAAATLRNVELHALASRDAPRLDALVEQLRSWRGKVLLGAVSAHNAFWFDEALRELGAAWMHRGEHAVMSDGASRHRLTIACRDPGRVGMLSFSGWNRSPAREWGALLGEGIATCALMPQLPDAALPWMGLDTQPRTVLAASATTYSDSFLSFVIRI